MPSSVFRALDRALRRCASALLLLPLPFASSAAQALPRVKLAPSIKRFVAVDDSVVALTHVRVIDGTGRPVADDQTIVLRDGRIAAVGRASAIAVPATARVLDLQGHTVIPGIVGMHEHTYFQTETHLSQMSVTAPRLYLANGVTTIRTTGSMFPYNEINMKRAIDEGTIVGPRMHITGPYLNGPDVHPLSNERHLRSEGDARRVVAYWAAEGATWLKVMGNVSRAVLAAIVDEAHQRGMRVTGHLCSITFREAAALGIDNVEHGLITDSDYVPGKQPDVCPKENMHAQVDVDVNGDAVKRSVRELIAHHVAVTSTLSVYELFVAGRAKLDPRALEALRPDLRTEVEASLTELGDSTKTFVLPLSLFQKMMRYDAAFARAGGLLVAGVDPWGNGSLPGYGDLRNFELLVEAGLSPEETIKVMTANGAAVLGEQGWHGTIEAGKVADLAVIQGDPARVPSEIYHMTLVFRDGIGYDSAKLIESVKGQVGLR